jgi:hypothetical protein
MSFLIGLVAAFSTYRRHWHQSSNHSESRQNSWIAYFANCINRSANGNFVVNFSD